MIHTSESKSYPSRDLAYRRAKRRERPASVKIEERRHKREAYARLSPEKKAKNRTDSRIRSQKIRDTRSAFETKKSRITILNYHYLKKYGITAKQADELRISQNRLCAICGTKGGGRFGVLHIDHCHKTGKVRGALCYRCNQALGYAKDDPDLLRKMTDYLEKHQ